MKKRYYNIPLLILFFVFCFSEVKGQTDTNFWFVAPRITIHNGGNTPINMRMASMGNACAITISEPANPSFTPIVKNLAANTSFSALLTNDLNLIQNQPPDSVLNYGIFIKSTGFITAYYDESATDNPEIFSLKGRNALGDTFYIPGQNYWQDHLGIDAYSAFDIVATEDNTTITITPSNDITGHKANIPFTKKLNKGQTYSARAISQLSSGHLEGSYVTSDKPIAITVSDDSAENNNYGGCYDLMGDQIVPVNVVGTEYIVEEGSLNHADKVFITATQNNTSIFINGSTTPSATITAGATYEYDVSSTTYIETSNPSYVYQVTGFGCEVGSAILPKIECTGSTEISFTRSLQDYFGLMLVVKTGGEDYFILNGNSTYIQGSSFSAVPGTNGAWKAAKISFPVNEVPVGTASLIKNTKARFSMGMITASGGTDGCSYGFFSDFNFTLHTNSSVQACLGDTLQLTVDTIIEGTYRWTGPNGFKSTLQNPIINNITKLDAGIYSVIASIDSCPSLPSIVKVVVNPKPSIKISPQNPTTCRASSITLTTSGAISCIWSPTTGLLDSTGTTVTANPSKTTTYRIKFIDSLGCKTDTSITVNVIPLPVVSLGKDTTICPGKSIILYAVGTGETYKWQDNSANDSLIVNSAGVYSVTVTGKNGCFNSDTVNVAERALPPVKINPLNPSICKDSILSLKATGADTYTWSPKPLFISTSGDSVTVQPTTTKFTYTTTGTDVHGCINKDSVQITVNPIPDVAATSSRKAICIGDTVLLFAHGAFAYSWSSPTELNILSDSVVIAKPTNALHSYTVKGKNKTGCWDTASIKITVNPLPVVDLVSDTGFCKGKSIILNAGGIQETYKWQDNSTNETITVNSVGVYSVTVTDNNGCINSALTNVKEDSLPTVKINPLNPSICKDSILSLKATGANTYIWSPNPLFISTSGDSVTILPATNNNFTLTTIGKDIHGCVNKDSVQITVNLIPNVTVTSSLKEICIGDTVRLFAHGAFSYSWSSASGLNISTDSVIKVKPNIGLNKYTVKGKDNTKFSCWDTVSININVNPLPVINLVRDTAFCIGKSIVLNAGGTNENYQWSNHLTTENITVNSAGVYSVTVTDINKCTDSASVQVKENPLPPVKITPDYNIICKDSILTLKVTGANTYTWSPPTGLSSTTGSTVTVTPTADITYIIAGTDVNGCVNEDSVVIKVNSIPDLNVTPSNQVICFKDSVTLTVQGQNGSPPYKYFWIDGDTSSIRTFTDNSKTNPTLTMYNYKTFVTVSDKGGCKRQDSINIYMLPNLNKVDTLITPPPSYFPAEGYSPLPVTFNYKNLSLTWNFGDGTSTVSNNTVAHTFYYDASRDPQNTGSVRDSVVYSVVGYPSCNNTKIVIVKVPLIFQIANVMTGDDDCNQYFRVKGQGLTDVEVIIYDRWGVKVYDKTKDFSDPGNYDKQCGSSNAESSDKNLPTLYYKMWDGTDKNGSIVRDGVYYYLLKPSIDVIHKSIPLYGTITIIRK